MPGERDLVLRKEGAELAVVEAVICKRSPAQVSMKQELANHFRRLFGYGVCRLFFHLTYCYADNPGSVLSELHRIAREDVPKGFRFIRSDELRTIDAQPPGFAAQYSSSLGEMTVVFLILDMLQQAQRDAAKAVHAK